MKFRSILLLAIGMIVATGAWLAHVFYLDKTIEIRFNEFVASPPITLIIVGMLLAFIVFYFSLKIFSLVVFFPQHLKAWHMKRAEKRKVRIISDGLEAMVLGLPEGQQKNFKSAADSGISPAVNYYLAAAVTKDEKAQKSLLQKAAKSEGDPMILAMATAQMRLKSNQPAEAAEVLRMAGASTHKANQPLRLLLQASEKSGDTRGALDVAQTLLKRDPSDHLSHLVGSLTSELLKDAVNSEDVRGLLGDVSKSGNSPAAIAIAAASRLAAVNDNEGASSILAQAWKDNKNAQILEAVAKFGSSELVQKILSQSNELQVGNTQDTEMLCALADLAMREKIWGQAHKFLDDALKVRKQRSIYLRMARLSDAEGKPSEDSNRLYKLAAQID